MSRVKINGTLASTQGFQLLKKNLEGRTDEAKFDPTKDPILSALGFEVRRVRNPEGKFDILAGVLDLRSIDEFDSIPMIEDEIVGEKGYNTSRYGGKRGLSKRTVEWLKAATEEDRELPDFVISDIEELTRSTQRLSQRAMKTKNFAATRVLTEGLKTTLTSFGAGSPTLKGKALFATDHPYGDDGTGAPLGTQSNKMTKKLTKEYLLEAIDLHRAMRDETGTRMGVASTYTLVIPRELERTAREILSNGLSFAGGEAANTNIPNTFIWDGFRVELMVLDTLNQPSTEYGTIGDDKQWFLINSEMSREMGAMKFIYLYDDTIEFYKSDDSKAVYYDIDLEFTADHFNYQVIVGSTGLDD